MVRCQICGREFKAITPLHLGNYHNLSMAEYRRMFPNAALRDPDIFSPETIAKLSNEAKKQWRDPEQRRKKIEGLKRYWATKDKEERAKEFLKRVGKRHIVRGDANPAKRPEVRRKIAEAQRIRMKGIKLTRKWRENIGKGVKKAIQEGRHPLAFTSLGEIHNEKILKTCKNLETKGYRVIPILLWKSGFPIPDGIVIDFDNKKVFALEVEDKEEDINPAKYSEWGRLYDDILWVIYKAEDKHRE